MSRNRKNNASPPAGGSYIESGNITFTLGPKGRLHVSGPDIQPMSLALQPKQTSAGASPGQGGEKVGNALQSCLLAATQMTQIQQQQFTLHQELQANSQMLITALTQVAASLGIATTPKKQRQYRAPQQQFQGQQQQRGQKQQRAQQQPMQPPQRQPQYA